MEVQKTARNAATFYLVINMRMIFNHLLFRMFGQAVERLQHLQREHEIIERWTKGDKEEKGRLSKQAEYVISTLLRNKDTIQSILKALEESKPIDLSPEQDGLVEIIRKTFRTGLAEYKSLVKYATEVGFDKEVLEGLKRDQRLPQGKKQQPEDPGPEEREDEEQ